MPAPTLPDTSYAPGWAGPSALEQLVIELVNRARANPEAEVVRIGTTAGALAPGASTGPVQPLAVVSPLDAAAQGHSDAMIERDFFSHTDPLTGQNPFQRMQAAGYTGYTTAGENIGFIGSSSGAETAARMMRHHQHLWESDGHQVNLLRAGYSEIGLGLAVGDYQGYPASTMVTQKFGDRGHAYLTGVVIDDTDGDRFYDIGEGQGGVRITAWNATAAVATSTFASGGYSLRLDPGTWTVRFEGGELTGVFERTVTIGSDNIKLDVIEGVDTSLFPPPGSGPAPGPDTGTEAMPDILAAFLAADPDTFVMGSKRNNVMQGTSGDDRLNGKRGNDTLRGNDGDDFLIGGSGKDRLYGGNGNDVLDGGSGNDRLWGGDGSDVFIFRAGGGRDRIEDFNTAEDVLALGGVGSDFALADHARVSKGNLVVTVGTGSVVLVGVTDVDAVDWLLI